MRHRNTLLLIATVLFLSALSAGARVISYAPYTDRTAYPAHQSRTNRHFAMLETAIFSQSSPPPSATFGQLVLYDFEGAEAPRVVYPEEGYLTFTAAAVREGADGTPSIFVQTTTPSLNGFESRLSVDGGRTWTLLALPSNPIGQLAVTGSDNGGPFASYRYSQVRIGTAAYPFVVALANSVYAIAADGTTKKIYEQPVANPPAIALAGRNRAGSEFIVRTNTQLITVDLNGAVRPLFSSFSSQFPAFEGFIAADGSVFIDERGTNSNTGKIWLVRESVKTELYSVLWTDIATPSVFAVPTEDYSAAWVIVRGSGHPTVLYKQQPGAPVEKIWEDVTGPDVEALHTGSSGKKLLVQVHRPRPAVDARIFKDPALAVWHEGQPAPRVYDELFLNEQWNKGFVHVDVEKIEAGEPFVFDGGAAPTGGGGGIIVSPPTSGGGDVVQEWGVVRASLKQQLVLPTVGRTRGAFSSDWSSDVIIQNSADAPQSVALRYVPNADSTGTSAAIETNITLAPLEIRMITDIVGSLFHIESGIGALFITPDAGVTVSSRTFSRAGAGTFGFNMGAIDVYAAAASPRFPVTFAGAFPGTNYRTNATITDTSGRGIEAEFSASGNDGAIGYGSSMTLAANSHKQINFLGVSLGLMSYETGALVITPKRGSAITAVFAIDNRTNDSTYFPPDLPSTFTARMIPAIGHLDGANGARFRSDLYLFNPSDQPRTVLLEAKAWDVPEQPAFLNLTLLGRESRVIRDVLQTAFGKTGIARLRYTSQSTGGPGVRVTSRTYNIDATTGGTFGFLMPPLNNFQIGGPADTLEILGAFASDGFRTNIGLVDMNGWPTGQNATARVEILDGMSKRLDSFTLTFPIAGGTQVNDVFRARGITYTGPVLVRVTPTNGTIGAYATTTDNITNDSSYLAANLAAKE